MRIKKLGKLFLFSTASILTLVFNSSWLNAQEKVSEKERYGGSLVIAIPNDPGTLDARYIQGSSTQRGQQQLYSALAEYGPKGVRQVVPGLATAWKRVDDVTWLVHLRRGVKFHNGKELTAEDVVKNFDWKINVKKYLDKGWRRPGAASLAVPIKSVEAVDKYTLKFTMKYIYPRFAEMTLNFQTRGIIDPDIVEKYEKQATLYPIGTGPFKLAEWLPGDHVTMERFDGYWAKRPYLDRVILRVIPDTLTRFIALQTGEVDIATELLLSQVIQLKKDPNLRCNIVYEGRRKGVALWFNHRRWPMNQLKFRQAVAMGVDWGGIVKASFPEGTGKVVRTLLQDSPLENPEAKKIIPPYDPKRAKQLLKEVEKEAGKPIPAISAIVSPGKQNTMANALQIAVEELKAIGLNSKFNVLPYNVHQDKTRRDPKVDWDVTIYDFVAPAVDPIDTMQYFYSKSPNAGDRQNMPGYNNPNADELILKGMATYDEKERTKIYQELEKIILKDLVVLPIFAVPTIIGYNKRVHDFPAHDSAKVWICTPWNNVWLDKEVK